MPYYFQQVASLKPNKCSHTTVCLNPRKKRRVSLKSLSNLAVKGSSAILSKQSKSKIETYINWIIAQAKRKQVYCKIENQYFSFRVNFITLTLPSKQVHSDKEITKLCLNQLLTEMRKLNKNLHYFWRAEKQSNGNIHYHLLTDTYYHYKLLRQDWNRITAKLGYIDSYKREFEHLTFEEYYCRYSPDGSKSKKEARKVWQNQKRIGWSNPNSTDVHAIKNIKDLAAYVAKYCAKDDEHKQVIGRRYGCDTNTRQNSDFKIYEGDRAFNQLRSLVIAKSEFTFNHEYGSVSWGRFHSEILKQNNSLSFAYKQHLSKFNRAYSAQKLINKGKVHQSI